MDERIHAVAVTADHKPDVEQELGAARLQKERLFRVDKVAYLNREVGSNNDVQRLAVSRSLGDFDLTGVAVVLLHLARCNLDHFFLAWPLYAHLLLSMTVMPA